MTTPTSPQASTREVPLVWLVNLLQSRARQLPQSLDVCTFVDAQTVLYLGNLPECLGHIEAHDNGLFALYDAREWALSLERRAKVKAESEARRKEPLEAECRVILWNYLRSKQPHVAESEHTRQLESFMLLNDRQQILAKLRKLGLIPS